MFLVGFGIYFIRLESLPILKIYNTARFALSGAKKDKTNHTVLSFKAFCIGPGVHVGVRN